MTPAVEYQARFNGTVIASTSNPVLRLRPPGREGACRPIGKNHRALSCDPRRAIMT